MYAWNRKSNASLTSYAVQTFDFTAVSARYIRFSATKLRANPNDGGRYRLQVAEFEVYDKTTQSIQEAADEVTQNINSMVVCNDTTSEDVMTETIKALFNNEITAEWSKAFILAPATAGVTGTIAGEITLRFGSESKTVPISKTINALPIPGVILGDVNEDKSVTVTDIVMLRGFIAGDILPTDNQFKAGDINEDGQLTVTDIVALRGIIAG